MKLSKFLRTINWNNVDRVHVTQDGKFYSFAVNEGTEKKIVTIGIGPKTTTLTVSDKNGDIFTHAVQNGGELSVFSPKA